LEGSGKGASLSMGAVRGAPFWGFGRMWGGGLRGWTSPHWDTLTGNSER